MKVTGVMFYYYYVCHRKLWLFSKDITFEKENENVMLGKLLDENSYKKDKKHIMIDETINIDFIRDWKVLHEIKKSRSIEEASLWQVKYYLYFLKSRGIEVEKGVLDFPKLKKIEEVYLSDEDIVKVKEILKDIEKIVNLNDAPNLINSKICKKCAYYEYCYI
ncbi:MAG: CRISPR-associated protein Cas4 [Psychrilyobacter sp.]|uniref:CRISPR-associated protein Cas4 n=1 Tax=Psychrilyobacter sp. TaxID=2586924 RepID=UPI003C75A12C